MRRLLKFRYSSAVRLFRLVYVDLSEILPLGPVGFWVSFEGLKRTEYCNNEYSCRLLGLPARLPGGRGDETFFFVVNVFFRPRSPPQRGACGMYAALRPVYRYIGTIIVTDPSFFSARCRRASRENWLSCSLALRSQVYEASVSCGGSDQAQQTTQRAFYQSPGNVFAIWMLRCHAVP